jgi:predicted dinucleotide-binding enzyme
MKTRVGIIGQGNVGSALKRGLERAGHDVMTAGHDERAVHAIATWADVIVLAVPYAALDDVLRETDGALDGKIVVDVTNALTKDFELAVGFTTSGAEQLQAKLPRAKVVKAFNTVFAQHMDDGHVKGQSLSAFVAGDDSRANAVVMILAKSIGFDPIDAGPLKNARWLETLGYLNIQLGFAQKMGTDIGFELIH